MTHQLGTYLTVFVGAGIGGALRHGTNRLAAAIGISSTMGTLIVNASGCLAAGLIAGFFAFRGESSQGVKLLLITGILGGYTTFSAFSLDTVLLWERGNIAGAIAYALGTVLISVLAVAAGLAAMRA